MRRNEIDMTRGNLYIQILSFALPLMASSVLQLLFNAVDIIVVGKFAGDTSMAAVSSTTALINLIVNLFIGMSVGINVACAKAIGARQNDRVSLISHTAVAMSVIFGVIVSAIGITAARPMLLRMGSPSNVIDLSVTYLRIYFLGATFNLLYNFGAALLRAKGDTKRPMYFLTIAGLLNMVLNLILVIVFKMGVAGVAIATIFSQFVSSVLVLYCLVKDTSYTHVDLKALKVDRESFVEIIRVGLPSGLQSVAFNIANVLIQSSVNLFGSVVMAGSGAAGNLEGFVWVIMNSITQACQAFVSQNYGAYKYKRMMQVLRISIIYVIFFGALSGVSFWYFGSSLLHIYTDTAESIAAGCLRLSFTCKWYFTCGVLDVMSGLLRSTGKATISFLGVVLGCCVFRVAYILTVFKANPVISNVYITYPLSWVITPVFFAIVFVFHLPKIRKICEASATEE